MPSQSVCTTKSSTNLVTMRKLSLSDLLVRLQHHNISTRRRRFLI